MFRSGVTRRLVTLAWIASVRFVSAERKSAHTLLNMKRTLRPHHDTSKIHGIIFDMDGTLTEPNSIDFKAMYVRNGLERVPGTDILTLINRMPDEQRAAAMEVILEEEMLGIERMMLRPHLHTTLDALLLSQLRVALSTRNCAIALDKFIERANIPHSTFHPALHRDSLDGINKPDPAVAKHILDHWEIPAGEEHLVWFVGDSLDDVACGKAAGCSTCLITTGSNHHVVTQNPDLVDLVIDSLDELIAHLKLDLPNK